MEMLTPLFWAMKASTAFCMMGCTVVEPLTAMSPANEVAARPRTSMAARAKLKRFMDTSE